MGKQYLVLYTTEDIPRSSIREIRDGVRNDLQPDANFGHRQFDIFDEDATVTPKEGFGFNLEILFPTINLLIIGYEIGEKLGYVDRVIERFSEDDDSWSVSSFEPNKCVKKPSSCIGEETWNWLNGAAQEDLKKSYEHVENSSVIGSIQHADFSLEHQLNFLYKQKTGDTPDSIWEAIPEFVSMEIDVEVAPTLLTNMEFIHSKRKQVSERDEALDEYDAMSVVIITEKTFNLLKKHAS